MGVGFGRPRNQHVGMGDLVWEKGYRRVQAHHRLSYEWLVGPIPPGMQLDHVCRVRSCEPQAPEDRDERSE